MTASASGSLRAYYFKFAFELKVTKLSSQLAFRAYSESDQPPSQPELQVRARGLSRGTVTTEALA